MEPDESERAERVRQFRDIAGEELDEDTCAALLASNDWNVEATARNFFEGPNSPRTGPAAPSNLFEPQMDYMDDDETTAFVQRTDEGVRARRRGISPERLDNNAAAQLPRTRSAGIGPANRSFGQIFKEAFTGQTHHESSAAAVRKFAAEFDRVVGSDQNVPEFFESSFEDALLSATTERRMLAVYLHSPWHPFTDTFCRDVLCSRSVLTALSDIRVWGGSVEHPEGYLASAKVQAAAFPCVVLIATDRGRDARIVDRLYIDDIAEPAIADRFAARIVASKSFRPAPVTVTPPIDARAVDERRRVVEEQDAALRSAMEQDRRREEEKRAREQAEEEERQRQREESERKAQEFESKRTSIRPEPAAGTADIATIRFQFPGGSKMSRKFEGGDTVQYLRDVLDVYLAEQLNTPHLRYALILNYPKKTLDDSTVSLKDAGLVPQAMLFLQDLDA